MSGSRGCVALLAAEAGRAEVDCGQRAEVAGLDIRQAQLDKGALRRAVGLGEDVHRRGNMGGIGLQCVHGCKFKQSRWASRGEDVRSLWITCLSVNCPSGPQWQRDTKRACA